MDLRTYFAAVQNQWRLVALTALIATLAALTAAFAEPPRYVATARALVILDGATRVDIEDALAYDVPAIIHGQQFTQDVAAALSKQGLHLRPDDVMRSLSATNQKREVTFSAAGADPDVARATLQTALAQLQHGGLQYWLGAAPISERPGLTITVLEPPTQARRANGVVAQAQVLLVRMGAGVMAGLALVAVQWYGAEAWRVWHAQPSEE